MVNNTSYTKKREVVKSRGFLGFKRYAHEIQMNEAKPMVTES